MEQEGEKALTTPETFSAGAHADIRAGRLLLYLFADANGPLYSGVSEVWRTGVVIMEFSATVTQRVQVKRLRRINCRVQTSCNLHSS